MEKSYSKARILIPSGILMKEEQDMSCKRFTAKQVWIKKKRHRKA